MAQYRSVRNNYVTRAAASALGAARRVLTLMEFTRFLFMQMLCKLKTYANTFGVKKLICLGWRGKLGKLGKLRERRNLIRQVKLWNKWEKHPQHPPLPQLTVLNRSTYFA